MYIYIYNDFKLYPFCIKFVESLLIPIDPYWALRDPY